jgi:hypothetical protein
MPPTTPNPGHSSTGSTSGPKAPPAPPPTPSAVPLTIGNITIHKLNSKNKLRAKTVLSKHERDKLDHNDKLALFQNVTKHRGGKEVIKALPNIITDPKQLDEFQHLDEMIEKLVSHFEHHDVADVSTLCFLTLLETLTATPPVRLRQVICSTTS